jgi:hypothetical protein
VPKWNDTTRLASSDTDIEVGITASERQRKLLGHYLARTTDQRSISILWNMRQNQYG